MTDGKNIQPDVNVILSLTFKPKFLTNSMISSDTTKF